MNPDKKTDYEAIQIYGWYFCVLLSAIIHFMLIWLMVNIMIDSQSIFVGNVIFTMILILSLCFMLIAVRKKVKQIKNS